ncbi:MAG TPA: hypothetical protein VGC94_03035 [Amnibacterium sp.]
MGDAPVMIRRSLRDLERRVLKAPPSARRFLKRGISVDDFFQRMNEAGVRYAALRWFETLPHVERGEDIDLLIGDDDLEFVASLLAPYPTFPATQKLDLYTASGLPGTDFRGMPYLGKRLADQVLDGAVLLKGRYRVPSPVDHLNSLAFHAVYHKGEASGLPATALSPVPTVPNPDHDYRATLERLAAETGRSVELTLHGLDRYLAGEGLRPATDTLERFQRGNAWLEARLAESREDLGPLAGLIVFVVREAAESLVDRITTTVDRFGFEVLRVLPLEGEMRDRVADQVRGGNWGRGPFPRSGGGPVTLIFAYDFSHRLDVDGAGHVLNPKSTLAKTAVRDLIAREVDASNRFNPMHSSDNGWQSLEYVEALGDPALVDDLAHRIEEIDRQVALPWPVDRYLSFNGKRAQVAVVAHPVHGPAVAKVFRPGSLAFFERELLARSVFGDVAVVSPLLESGAGWLLSPLYEDDGRHVRRRLPGTKEVQLRFDALRQVAAFVAALRERGYFILDLTSHNLLSDRRRGLLVTDFEFLQAYPAEVPPLDRDWTVLGVADDPTVDQPVLPLRKRWDRRVRTSLFHPAIAGLSVEELLNPRSIPLLRVKMESVQLGWYVLFAIRAAAGRLGRTRFGRIAQKRIQRLKGRG